MGDVCRMVSERLHLLPPFRWRLVEVPFGIDLPYWVEDPAFDLDFHIRDSAVPPPGDDQQLAETVARIFARPLDRSRPLWELYLIHGLPEGRVAMLTKLHHSMVDGVSGNEILGVLLDPSPEGKEIPPAPKREPGERVPGDLEMLGRGLLGVPRQPLRALRSLPTALPNLTDLPGANAFPVVPWLAGTLSRARGEDPGLLEVTTARPPKTSFNGRVSSHRRFAFGSLSLDTVKRLKNELGITVNDVVVALCATAVRDWLLDRDELPEEPLVAMIPVSVRTEEQMGTFGNRISTMIVPIPTNVEDPRERLLRAHEYLREREGAPQGAARRPADRRDELHPARGGRARGAHDDGHPRPHAPAAQPRDLQRPRPARPALLRRRAAAGELPGLGRDRRRRAQHDGHELPRPRRLRDHRRPRPGRRRVVADGRVGRRARRARDRDLRQAGGGRERPPPVCAHTRLGDPADTTVVVAGEGRGTRGDQQGGAGEHERERGVAAAVWTSRTTGAGDAC